VKTRILKVHLGRALQDKINKGAKRSELSATIGVSPQTLSAMLNDDWQWIARDSIERAADYLQLEAHEVFEFAPVEFWRPIQETGQCTFLRGEQEGESNERNLTIPTYDAEATNVITELLKEHMSKFTYFDHRRNQDDLIDTARSQNCIVIGSPKSNVATEILLSRFFNAEPFNPSAHNRYKIPFGFCWPDAAKIVEQSSLTCSSLARKRTNNTSGIAVKDGPFVEAHYKKPEDFWAWSTIKGKDCGLVFVANKPFGTEQDVKLIVLAGFSGIGTVGAAKALVEDFRYLEPNPGEGFVYGVVDCWYTKAAKNLYRSFKKFRWRARVNGSSPISTP
jgi:hypothetical protein